MASYDNTYSRLVAWLKVILPLTALAILSTLFLVSQKHDPDAALPYSEVEVEEILREQSIVAPRYTGVTSDGAAVSLTAERAHPDDGAGADAERLRMRIDMPGGGTVQVTATHAKIDMSAKQARLTDGVRIETSTGYTLASDAVTSTLDVTRVETDADVTGSAPYGALSAGKMLIRKDSDQVGAPYVLLFTDGVSLIYVPKQGQGGRQ